MADRVGVIDKGRLILVEDKTELMRKFGGKHLTLQLVEPLAAVPAELAAYGLRLQAGGGEITYVYDSSNESKAVAALLDDVKRAGLLFHDLRTSQRSLEDIFVGLVGDGTPR